MLDLIVNKIAGFGTLLMLVLVLFISLFFIYRKLFGRIPVFINKGYKVLKGESLFLAFIIMLSGMILSLVYSEVIGYPPCSLCWIQRALIYPQVFILGFALWKKYKKIFYWVLPLNIVGILISGYQYYGQIFLHAEDCPIGEIACFGTYLLEYGFITIPFMAFVSFVLVGLLTWIYSRG